MTLNRTDRRDAKLHFSHLGITATLKTSGPPTFAKEPCKFVVARPNVPPGVYDGAVGRFGIRIPARSSGTLPEVVEKLPNNAHERIGGSPARRSTPARRRTCPTISSHCQEGPAPAHRVPPANSTRVWSRCHPLRRAV